MKVVVEQEGVDEPGFSGRLGRARKGAAVAELIDEAAFADVGFSSNGNLRQSDALKLPVLRHRGNKFCFFDFQFRISFWGMSGFWGMCDFFWCSGCSVAPMGATICGKLKEQVGARF